MKNISKFSVSIVVVVRIAAVDGVWGGHWFSCGIVQCGKTLISIFQQFSAAIKKFWVWGEDWPLGYNFMEFEISLIFPKS